jgi:uncharacterized protein YdhG (YjbR/CyaY superfamily)
MVRSVTMKKPSPGVPKNIDEYLARIPEPARSTLSRLRANIRTAVPPEATEAISYGIPTFKYKGSLVAFGAFTKHCSLFPMSKAVIKKFHQELKNFPTSKGTIQFPQDKPLSATLLKKIVQARIAENERGRSGDTSKKKRPS